MCSRLAVTSATGSDGNLSKMQWATVNLVRASALLSVTALGFLALCCTVIATYEIVTHDRITGAYTYIVHNATGTVCNSASGGAVKGAAVPGITSRARVRRFGYTLMKHNVVRVWRKTAARVPRPPNELPFTAPFRLAFVAGNLNLVTVGMGSPYYCNHE